MSREFGLLRLVHQQHANEPPQAKLSTSFAFRDHTTRRVPSSEDLGVLDGGADEPARGEQLREGLRLGVHAVTVAALSANANETMVLARLTLEDARTAVVPQWGIGIFAAHRAARQVGASPHTGRVPMFQLRTRSSIHPFAPMLAVAIALSLIALTATAGPSGASRVHGFVAALTAEAEVPEPGPPGATGTALILIDLNGETAAPLCYKLTVVGLAESDQVNAAHIHVGAAGVAGDVLVPLFTEPPTGEMAGCVDDADLDLLAQIDVNPAGYYVNVHTEAYPDGAVRGQLETAGVATGAGCTFLAALGLTPGGEGTDTLTVAVGEDLVFWGYLVPMETVQFTFTFNGQPFGDWTPLTADADGYVSFVHFFQSGHEGRWTVTASVPEAECAGTVNVTVGDGTPPPAMPDTAVRSPELPPMTLGASVLLVAIGGGMLTNRMARRPRR